MNTITRNADLPDLMALLKDQHARKVDVVAPAHTIRADDDGRLHIEGAEAEITEDGVTATDGIYVPTGVALEGIADKLKIPIAYVRRIHESRPDLFAANVNGWLLGSPHWPVLRPDLADDRSFLVRCFKGDDGDGIARAFLSDTYKMIDNIDVLMAALDGIRAAGLEVHIDGGDLTERRMRVRVVAPEIKAYATTLMRGYRSPWSGNEGADNPTVFAGLEIGNSETGNGAFSIVPRIVFEICNNGATITKDAVRNVHLGSRLEAGVVKWSEETQQKNLELVYSQTRDAVTTFLDVDYITRLIERMEEKSEAEVSTPDEVRNVTKPLGFTDEEIDSVMGYFIKGGQTTLGGVMNAATAYAQEVPDGDRAAEIEAAAAGILL